MLLVTCDAHTHLGEQLVLEELIKDLGHRQRVVALLAPLLAEPGQHGMVWK